MIQERLKLLIEFKIVQYRNKKTGSHLVLHPHKKLYLSRLSGLADIEKYKGININEKIFRYLWDDNIEHTCRICSESVELHTLGSGWREFCSKKCVEVKDTDTLRKQERKCPSIMQTLVEIKILLKSHYKTHKIAKIIKYDASLYGRVEILLGATNLV